jgi:short-subunit dehydrogenase
MDIKNKIAWVTGASSGIGRALAIALSTEGAMVILSGRRQDALEETASVCFGPTHLLPFEATDFDHIPVVVARAVKWQGTVNILVNNAGISQRSLAVETVPEVYRRIIEVDLLAPILLTQALLSHLIATKPAMIVTISSLAGRVGSPMRTAYCAAKHGIIGYMDALRGETELAYGLKLLNVLPGSVATPVARNALTADGTPQIHSDSHIYEGISPNQCAKEILEAMRSDRRELIVADGNEAQAAILRHSDPDLFFEMVAQAGAQIAGLKK